MQKKHIVFLGGAIFLAGFLLVASLGGSINLTGNATVIIVLSLITVGLSFDDANIVTKIGAAISSIILVLIVIFRNSALELFLKYFSKLLERKPEVIVLYLLFLGGAVVMAYGAVSRLIDGGNNSEDNSNPYNKTKNVSSTSASSSNVDLVGKYGQMFKDGLLTKEEFEAKKKELL